MIESWDTLIDQLGGTGVVAGEFGLSASIVSGWRKRGIPSARWLGIVGLAKARDVAGVTLEALATLESVKRQSTEPAEARP